MNTNKVPDFFELLQTLFPNLVTFYLMNLELALNDVILKRGQFELISGLKCVCIFFLGSLDSKYFSRCTENI